MEKHILYSLKTESISVEILAFFKDEKLIISGYDIGKTVKEMFGDSDYEYSTTVPGNEVIKLYPLLNIEQGDKTALLKKIAAQFNENNCFSEFNKFLEDNKIDSSKFFWH